MKCQKTVPPEWKWSKVKYTADFFTGWTPPTGTSKFYEGENLWANISDLGSRELVDTAKRISDEAVRLSAIRPSPAGSLLFSFKLSIGQVSFAGHEMFTNEAIATFPPQPRLNMRWAYWAFPLFIPLNAGENIYGAKLLNQELIRSAPILVPPLQEQERIANFLDEKTVRIDALIAEKERLEGKLLELRNAYLEAEIAEAFKNGMSPLKRSLVFLGQGWSPVAESSPASEDAWGVLKLSAIKQGQFIPTENKALSPDTEIPFDLQIQQGDVLVTRANTPELVGSAALVEENTHKLIPSDLIYTLRVNTKLLDARFLTFYLSSPQARAAIESDARGSSQSMVKLSQEHIRSWQIPNISVDAQLATVERLEANINKIRKLRRHVQEHISLLREYRSSLISTAVTGHLNIDGYKGAA